MKNIQQILICSALAVLLSSCGSDAGSSGKSSCSNTQVDCNGSCVSLADMHWTSCGICDNGFEDKDGNAENGCESAKTSDNSGNNNSSGCASNQVDCSGKCISLAKMHWASCGACADGFEDTDGNADNGCETDLSKIPPVVTCDSPSVLCNGKCVVLAERNWASCGVCALGYADQDADASNGCETKTAPASEDNTLKCNDGTVLCGEKCVSLADLHWAACGKCEDGYENKDENDENGCESVILASGDCSQASDCDAFAHVTASECVDGKCVISECAQGYADCDGNVLTGCEVNGQTDYYNCGAKAFCDSDNAGKQCNLGEQCSGGACVPVPEIIGCSDGTREGFIDLIRFNNLAACGGAWTVPGIHHNVPACGRTSGNTGTNAAGTGCNLEDLCAEGWHVCLGRGDVMTRSDYGCEGILDGVNQNEPALFITRTSSTGSLNCDPDTVGVPLNMNDIFGCGNFGCYATGSDCDPLKLSSHNLCSALRGSCGCSKNASGTVSCNNNSGSCYGGGYGHSIDYFNALNGKTYSPAWDCGNDQTGTQEARDIVKSLPDQQGGVMCCKDQCQEDSDCGVGLICRYHVCVECIRKADGSYEGCPSGKKCSQQHTCI